MVAASSRPEVVGWPQEERGEEAPALLPWLLQELDEDTRGPVAAFLEAHGLRDAEGLVSLGDAELTRLLDSTGPDFKIKLKHRSTVRLLIEQCKQPQDRGAEVDSHEASNLLGGAAPATQTDASRRHRRLQRECEVDDVDDHRVRSFALRALLPVAALAVAMVAAAHWMEERSAPSAANAAAGSEVGLGEVRLPRPTPPLTLAANTRVPEPLEAFLHIPPAPATPVGGIATTTWETALPQSGPAPSHGVSHPTLATSSDTEAASAASPTPGSEAASSPMQALGAGPSASPGPPGGQNRTRVKIFAWFARLGNWLAQICHAIHLAKAVGASEVELPSLWQKRGYQLQMLQLLSLPAGTGNAGVVQKVRPAGKGFHRGTQCPPNWYDLDLRMFFEHCQNVPAAEYRGIMQEHVRPLVTDGLSACIESHRADEDLLTIHLRSDDIFKKPNQRHAGWHQPPCSVYEKVFFEDRFRSILVVAQDKLNPCMDWLVSFGERRNVRVTVQSSTSMFDDVCALLSAQSLV